MASRILILPHGHPLPRPLAFVLSARSHSNSSPSACLSFSNSPTLHESPAPHPRSGHPPSPCPARGAALPPPWCAFPAAPWSPHHLPRTAAPRPHPRGPTAPPNLPMARAAAAMAAGSGCGVVAGHGAPPPRPLPAHRERHRGRSLVGIVYG